MNQTKRERLETELRDLRHHVADLEHKLQLAIEQDQHQTIDHLEEHINVVEDRFKGLKSFIKALFEDNKN
ncbi:MAG: hypothetical protein ACSHX6_01235 [Akkermansiaceae bacterium]